MRKVIVALLLVAFSVTTSFAADLAASSTGVFADAGKTIFPNALGVATASPTAVGKLSTGVYFSWNTTTTAYAIKTQHNSGTRAFGTSSDSTAITWKTVGKGADLAAPAGTSISELMAEGSWSIM